MAERFIDLTESLVPDPANADAPYWQPALILDANDLFDGIQILAYADGSTKIGAMCRFTVPDDYVNGAVWRVRSKCNATTGNFVLDFDYKAIAIGESGDPSAVDQNTTVTDGAEATARLLIETTSTPTAGNFTAGDEVFVMVSRDLTDGSDTLAVALELISFHFVYDDGT